MQEILNKLEQVQEVDLQIDTLLRKKAELPEKLKDIEQKIQELTKAKSDIRAIVDELEKGKRQQLGALELNEDRVKRTQERLEQIKTNDEYQALLKELDGLKKSTAVLQENEKKISEEISKHNEEIVKLDTQLGEFSSQKDVILKSNLGDEEKLTKGLNELQAKRDQLTVGVNSRYLAAYDKIRQGKLGIGIAHANNGCCRACNMRLPPQLYNELQRCEEILNCPSCRRILIFRDQRKEENALNC